MAEPPPTGRSRATSTTARRLTEGQQAAWERWWPVRGRDVADLVSGAAAYDPPAWFGRDAPLILEIGSGMGESTAALAAAEPDVDHLAVEVFEPGIAALLMRVEAAELTNLAVLRGDAVALLSERRAGGLAGTRSASSSRTRGRSAATASAGSCSPRSWRSRRPAYGSGGTLHMATDWDDYAVQMRSAADAEPRLENTAPGWAPRPDWRPVTKFEARARVEGRAVHDLIYRRS